MAISRLALRNTLKQRARDCDEAQWRNHVEPRWRVASRFDNVQAVELAAGLIGKDSVAGGGWPNARSSLSLAWWPGRSRSLNREVFNLDRPAATRPGTGWTTPSVEASAPTTVDHRRLTGPSFGPATVPIRACGAGNSGQLRWSSTTPSTLPTTRHLPQRGHRLRTQRGTVSSNWRRDSTPSHSRSNAPTSWPRSG